MNAIPVGRQLARTPPTVENPRDVDRENRHERQQHDRKVQALKPSKSSTNWEDFSEIVLPGRKPLQNIGVNQQQQSLQNQQQTNKRTQESHPFAQTNLKRQRPAQTAAHQSNTRNLAATGITSQVFIHPGGNQSNIDPVGRVPAQTPVGVTSTDGPLATTGDQGQATQSSEPLRNIIPAGRGLARTPVGQVERGFSIPEAQSQNYQENQVISSDNPIASRKNLIPAGNGLARTPVTLPAQELFLNQNKQPQQQRQPLASKNTIPSGGGLARTPITQIQMQTNGSSNQQNTVKTSVATKEPVSLRNVIPSGAGLARTPIEAPLRTLAEEKTIEKQIKNTIPTGIPLAQIPMHDNTNSTKVNHDPIAQIKTIRADRNAIPSGGGLARTPISKELTDLPSSHVPSQSQEVISVAPSQKNLIPSGNGLARTPLNIPTRIEAAAPAIPSIPVTMDSGNQNIDRAPKATKNIIPTGKGLARTPLNDQEGKLNSTKASQKEITAEITRKKNVIPTGRGLARTPLTDMHIAGRAQKLAETIDSGEAITEASGILEPKKNMIPSGNGLARTPANESPKSKAFFHTNNELESAGAFDTSAQQLPRKNVIPTGNGLARTPILEEGTAAAAAVTTTMGSMRHNQNEVNQVLANEVRHARNVIPSGTDLSRTPVTEATNTNNLLVTANLEKSEENAPALPKNMIPTGNGLSRTPLHETQAAFDIITTNQAPQALCNDSSVLPSISASVEKRSRNLIPTGKGLARTPLDQESKADFLNQLKKGVQANSNVTVPHNEVNLQRQTLQDPSPQKQEVPQAHSALPPERSGGSQSSKNPDSKKEKTGESPQPHSDTTKQRGTFVPASKAPKENAFYSSPNMQNDGVSFSDVHASLLSDMAPFSDSFDGRMPHAPTPRFRHGSMSLSVLTPIAHNDVHSPMSFASDDILAKSPILDTKTSATPKSVPKPPKASPLVPAEDEAIREVDVDDDDNYSNNVSMDNVEHAHNDSTDEQEDQPAEAVSNNSQHLMDQDHAYLRHLENVKKLERIREDLQLLRREHKDLGQRADEVDYRTEIIQETKEETAMRTRVAATWLQKLGYLSNSSDTDLLRRVSEDQLKEAMDKITNELESMKATHRERTSALQQARMETETVQSSTPVAARIGRSEEAEQALRDRIRQQAMTIRSIQSKMRDCDSVLSTPAQELSDAELHDLRSQQGHLHRELRSLRSAEVNDKTEAAARRLLRRVEMFIIRYESLRRSARFLRRSIPPRRR